MAGGEGRGREERERERGGKGAKSDKVTKLPLRGEPELTTPDAVYSWYSLEAIKSEYALAVFCNHEVIIV